MRSANNVSRGERVAIGLGVIVVGLGIVELIAPGRVSRVIGRRPRGAGREPDTVAARASITIGRPIAEVFAFWRQFQNFPWFMRHLESVKPIGHQLTRWTVTGPAGLSATWDAQIVTDQENHMISWRSVPGSMVENRGAVRFEDAPMGRGTEVHVELRYRPPTGRLGHLAAWLFGTAPRQQMREGLRRVKQLLEVGEIPLSEGPALSRAARPPAEVQEINELEGVAR